MEKLPKRKATVCKEHHKACKCREKAFNDLLQACWESLELSEYYDPYFDSNEPWEGIRKEREIGKITDQIRKAVETALKSNGLVNEEITGYNSTMKA